MFWNRKPSGSVIVLRDATPDDWASCGLLHHVPTTYQYGFHPMRVYQFCPFCHIKSRLDWKDTYARTMNRIWGTMPALVAAVFTFVTVISVLVYIGILRL
jgi:hypothetical protein